MTDSSAAAPYISPEQMRARAPACFQSVQPRGGTDRVDSPEVVLLQTDLATLVSLLEFVDVVQPTKADRALLEWVEDLVCTELPVSNPKHKAFRERRAFVDAVLPLVRVRAEAANQASLLAPQPVADEV